MMIADKSQIHFIILKRAAPIETIHSMQFSSFWLYFTQFWAFPSSIVYKKLQPVAMLFRPGFDNVILPVLFKLKLSAVLNNLITPDAG